jgi:hypothetical protein
MDTLNLFHKSSLCVGCKFLSRQGKQGVQAHWKVAGIKKIDRQNGREEDGK